MIHWNRSRNVKARALAVIRRVHAAAMTMPKPLRYRAISGDITVLVDSGQLVRTGDILAQPAFFQDAYAECA